jgi:hypothetical protein
MVKSHFVLVDTKVKDLIEGKYATSATSATLLRENLNGQGFSRVIYYAG